MTNQLSTSITNKIHYSYRPGVNADTFSIRIRHTETSRYDIFDFVLKVYLIINIIKLLLFFPTWHKRVIFRPMIKAPIENLYKRVAVFVLGMSISLSYIYMLHIN